MALLLGVPAMGIAVTVVLVDAYSLDTEEVVERTMGSADILVTADYDAGATTTMLVDLLPPDSELLARRLDISRVSSATGVVTTDVLTFDYGDPLATGIVHQESGAPPHSESDVVLTPALSSALAVSEGETVRIRGGIFTVVGIAELPNELGRKVALVRSAAFKSAPDEAPQWLVDLPDDLDRTQTKALESEGFQAYTREQVGSGGVDGLAAPPTSTVASRAAIPAFVACLALVQGVFLAGPAFAIGARRSRQQLAQVLAVGGEARDIRRLVLSSGAVLGFCGGVIGTVAGVGLATVIASSLQSAIGRIPGAIDVNAVTLIPAAAFGVLIGVVAAWLPARAASRRTIMAASLNSLPGPSPARWQGTGAAAVAIGIPIAIAGGAAQSLLAVLLGTVLAETGLIMSVPGVIVLMARVANHLPVIPRLAARDASRHRGRTTAAVAAILSAVAFAVAIAVFTQTEASRRAATYSEALNVGEAAVSVPSTTSADDMDELVEAVRRVSPEAELTPVSQAVLTKDPRMFLGILSGPSDCFSEEGCVPAPVAAGWFGELVVAPTDRSLAVPGLSGAAQDVLSDGKAAVFSQEAMEDGFLTLGYEDSGALVEIQVPAEFVPMTEHLPALAVVPESTLHRNGMRSAPGGILIASPGGIDEQEEAKVSKAIVSANIPGDPTLHVERGFQASSNPVMLAMLVGTVLVTVAAAIVASALAKSDGERDLATLQAVGADSSTTRHLAGAQAGVISVMGVGLGVLAGTLPATAVLLSRRESHLTASGMPFLDVPWGFVLAIVLVVPLLSVGASLIPSQRTSLTMRSG